MTGKVLTEKVREGLALIEKIVQNEIDAGPDSDKTCLAVALEWIKYQESRIVRNRALAKAKPPKPQADAPAIPPEGEAS